MTKSEILEKATKNCPYENAECVIYRSGFLEGYLECLKDLGKYEELSEQDNISNYAASSGCL